MSAPEPRPGFAIALKCASVFLFVVMSALIKAASAEVPPGEAVFFRSFFAIPVILLWLVLRGQLSTGLKVHSVVGHMQRGLIGSIAMGLSFAGLAILPLTEVKAIQYAAPIFVVIFAALLLGERIKLVRITAVAMGMIGVLVILWPRLSAFGDTASDPLLAIGAIIVLSGAICAAMAQIFIRKMVATEATSAIVFWFSVTASVLALLTVPFGWVLPSQNTVLMLVAAGLIGGAAQILLTSAYRFADASIVAPFDYATILFALVIGYYWFGEIPTGATLLGAVLVILAGVLIIFRERQLNIRRGKARPAMTSSG